MKKIKIIAGLSLILLLNACTSHKKETYFDKFGISFTCPAGWKIDYVEENEFVQVISIERQGFSSQGSVAIILTKTGAFEIEEYVDFTRQAITEQESLPNMRMSEIIESMYGKYNCLFYTYTIGMMKIDHEARVYIFSAGDNFVAVTENEMVSNKEKNAEGFEKIRESFLIK